MVMRVHKQTTQQLDQEIIELQSLGFEPESDVIGVLRSHKAALFQGPSETPEYDLDLLHGLQKKMLMSYITEAKLLRKRGVALHSNIMRFAYDKIIRLTIAVAELERQLKEDAASQDISEFQKRVDRMKEITRQSIAHYKKRLRNYVQRVRPNDEEKLQQTRDTLAIRVKHFYQMV